jgi:integral membrane protein
LPEAVRITGSFHGILFVLLIYMLWQAKNKGLMSFKQLIIAILLSFLPAGTFFLHKCIRAEKVD